MKKILTTSLTVVMMALAVATAGGALALSYQPAKAVQLTASDMNLALESSEGIVVKTSADSPTEVSEDSLATTDHPSERVSCPLVLRRLSGGLTCRDGELWVISEDDVVIVWLELPKHERLMGEFEATYPYKVADGEQGTIEVEYRDKRNNFYVHEKLQFIADGDLTLEHGVPDVDAPYMSRGKVKFHNDPPMPTSQETSPARQEYESTASSYGCFALNTSSGNSPHRQVCVDVSPYCSVRYHIAAVGDFDPALYDTPRCATCHNDLARRQCSVCEANPEFQP